MTRVCRRASKKTLLVWIVLTMSASSAGAEPIVTTFGVDVVTFGGRHATRANSGAQGIVAIPLAELELRRGRDALRFEGLPALGIRTAGVTSNLDSVTLSVLNASFHHTLFRGFFVGAGIGVYNQRATLRSAGGRAQDVPPFDNFTIMGEETQTSRVAGARYEAGNRRGNATGGMEFSVTVSPGMHGIQYTRLPRFSGQISCGSTPAPCRIDSGTITLAFPESATQLDAVVRLAHRMTKSTELFYRVRYINYTARNDVPHQPLADRNVGIGPLFGFRTRL